MATWGADWLEYDASNTVQQSQARSTRDLQRRDLNSVDHQQSPAAGDVGATWLEDSGRALQRVLAAVLAGILSLLLAWRILLGLDEAEVERRTADCPARTTTLGGREVTGMIDARVCGQIDPSDVGGSSTQPVTHDNATAAAAPGRDLASQVGEAAAPGDSLPGNLRPFGAQRAPAGSSAVDMPSRNSAATGEGIRERNGDGCIQPHGRLSDDGADITMESTHNFPRRSTTNQEMLDDFTGMSGTESAVNNEQVPTFRRRPLMCTDDDEDSESPTSSDDLNLFHALVAQDDSSSDRDERRLDPDDREETGNLPEVTSSTWISLFRAYFMDGQLQQQLQSAAAEPVRRQRDHDVDDLLDRTLSTITEEGPDELARKMSEMDDELASLAARQQVLGDEDMMSYSSDDDETNDDGYYDVSFDAASWSATRRTVVTPTNVEPSRITDQRRFTSTRSADELDVQVPCSDSDTTSNYTHRQSTAELSPSDGQLPVSVNDLSNVGSSQLNSASTSSRHKSRVVDAFPGSVGQSKAEAEVARNVACARCTVVARCLPGDDAQMVSRPPSDVADVVVSAEGFADARSRYAAVSWAAVQAASAAISDAVGQVRHLANSRRCDDDDDEVELELSTRCVVRCVSSSRHRSEADNSRCGNHVSPKVITNDDVISGLRSDACRPEVNSTRQGDATSSCATLGFRHPTQNVVADVVADRLAVDSRAVSALNSRNMPSTTTQNDVMGYSTDVGDDCRNNQSDDNAAGGANSRFVASNKSECSADVNASRSTCRQPRTGRQHHANLPSTAFTASHLVRSASESDLDVQSTSSSLYADYAESPGSIRRRQRRQRQNVDEDASQRTPSRPLLHRGDNVDDRQHHGDRGGDRSPWASSRHRRRAPAQHVSSSFENLVGGLLAVPQPQQSRHLANPNTTYNASNNYNSADSLCGRGDDILPALTAFLSTGAPATATARGSRYSLSVDATSDPEPVLPRSTKQPPQHVRRAKHLFKSCQSCVRGRSDNDAKS